MYTNHLGTKEYPYFASFYHFGIDESKPLDQQFEEKILSFETFCDIADRNNSLTNESFTLYFPLDVEKEIVKISIGENVEVDTFGLLQRGRVLGVFPSTVGGVVVVCSRV